MEKEPERYYDWMLWMLRKEKEMSQGIVKKNFKDNDYRDVLNDGKWPECNGTSGNFLDKYNNISAIYFNINSKGIKYEIVWINKN